MTTETLSVRCSKLPLLGKCPASAGVSTEHVVNSADLAARLGTSIHDCISKRILGQEIQMIAPCGIDQNEWLSVLDSAWRTWLLVRDKFPQAQTEVPYSWKSTTSGITLSGRIDIISRLDDEVRIADIKTGWEDGDYQDQLRGYAWIALSNHQNANRAYCVILRVRDRSCEEAYYERNELEKWWQSVEENLMRGPNTFVPGRWCSRCPLALTCPARTQMLVQASNVILGHSHIGNILKSDDLIRLWESARLMERLCTNVREQIAATVAASGGEVKSEDGNVVLGESVQEHKEISDVSAALPILVERLGEEVAMRTLSCSVQKVRQAAMNSVPHGQKTKAAMELMQELSSRGVVSTKTVTRLEVRSVNRKPIWLSVKDENDNKMDVQGAE